MVSCEQTDPRDTDSGDRDRDRRLDSLLSGLRSWAGGIETLSGPGPTAGSKAPGGLQPPTWDRRLSRSHRFHYLLRAGLGVGADQLPDRQRLGAQIDALDPPLPTALSAALLEGWPPALRGLHRIELVPGLAWVSVAIGLDSAARRAAVAGAALNTPLNTPINTRLIAPAIAPEIAPATAPEATADAIVVGAGLAGCALADSLTRRGWRVTVIESRDRIGGAVADVPLLAQHPALSPGADRRSRLLVAALLTSARLRHRLGDAFSWCGRFQPMPIEEAGRRTLGVPPDVAEAIDDSVAAIHGVAGLQGIWYPQCAMADPQRWWRRLLRSPQVQLRISTGVARLSGGPGAWQAQDSSGCVIATAQVLILANQTGAFALAAMPQAASGHLRISSQQVAIGTALAPADGISVNATGPDSGTWPGARPTLSGVSYRIEQTGVRCVAGPIRQGQADPLFVALTHAGLPYSTVESEAGYGGDGYQWHVSPAAERLLLRDNLPMIGMAPDCDAINESRDRFERNDRLPLPRRDGLYLLTGLGGRGLLWSVLGAEVIAARLNGEPGVVEPELLEAVDPARFLKRMLRRARSTRTEANRIARPTG